jgi:thiol:disulfide interchange protein DsbG
MFVDPLCSYSVRALQEVQPLVASGRVQVAVIPVSVLDYEDNGMSTPSALALVSKPADQMIAAWAHGDLKGPAGTDAERRLRVNMAASEAIGLRGTPTVIWRKADGSEGRIDGLPGDWNAVIATMGGESHADLTK